MTSMGLAQSLILLEMIPASLSCLISCSTNPIYFNGTVYGLDATSRPLVGISNSVRWVLPMSTADLDTILLYLMSSSCLSPSGYLRYNGCGMDFTTLLVLGSNCRLVASGILGSTLDPLDGPGSWLTSDHLTSWICLHFSAGTNVARGEFFLKLEMVLLVLECRIVMFVVFCGPCDASHQGE